MNLLQRFLDQVRNAGFFATSDKLLLAVSGGIDSVVLCELSRQAGLNFSIAHGNFGLRGEESERDERFVRNLAAHYGVEIFVMKFETATYAQAEKLSIQEAARDLRYNWFEQLRKEKKMAAILLAHHADDNMETLLMHFFRGTGLQGLTAIPESNIAKKLFRPLLHFRRKEIEAFARQEGLSWVEDSSNASLKYARNNLRHEILPAVKNIYPAVEENLLHNIERFREINAFYRLAVEKLKMAISERRGEEVRFPVKRLSQLANRAFLFEIIKEYGFGEKQVDEVAKLLHSDSGKFTANESHQIIRHRNWIVIAPKASTAETVAMEEGQEEVRFSGGILYAKQKKGKGLTLGKERLVAKLDAGEITYPLLIRKWTPGDYFYPLGMRKKKKLARFFIDQKLSKNQKESIWVVESGKRIAWIIGLRIDDRFKVSPSTASVLQLTFSPIENIPKSV